MSRKPPAVGQTLYSLNVGNYARRGVEQVLTPVIVKRVGRKYFAVKHGNDSREIEFSLEDWREKTEYCVNHKLYESPEEWESEKEEGKICREIADAFQFGRNFKGLSINKLRAISKIINEP